MVAKRFSNQQLFLVGLLPQFNLEGFRLSEYYKLPISSQCGWLMSRRKREAILLSDRLLQFKLISWFMFHTWLLHKSVLPSTCVQWFFFLKLLWNSNRGNAWVRCVNTAAFEAMKTLGVVYISCHSYVESRLRVKLNIAINNLQLFKKYIETVISDLALFLL